MKPLISIIIPVYNVEPYLEGCLQSILNQTFKNFEVILVNDGSTDKSGDVCSEFSKKDNRVKVINKEYGGVSSARNAGLKMAQGEYIGFVDGDDYIDKDMYKDLYELCKKTNSDISISKLGREINGEIINKENDYFIKELNNTEAMRELFKGILYRFSLCNKLFNRKCFNGIQFPEGRIHEDLSTTYRLFANSDKAAFLNKIGYIYVKRENSILTTKFNEKRLDAFIGWEEIIKFMKIQYPDLSEEYLSCFTYGCLDNVYYILDQVEIKEIQLKYLRRIQKYIKENYKDLRRNRNLSNRGKYIITLLKYSIKLFMVSIFVQKFVKKISIAS